MCAAEVPVEDGDTPDGAVVVVSEKSIRRARRRGGGVADYEGATTCMVTARTRSERATAATLEFV